MMMQSNLVHEGERLDELQRNGYGIIQNPARFCFGMDAVLLSGFAKAKAGEKVLDLGTGTGIIPILMEAKTDAADFTALEIQEESADMARRSVAYNHLEDKIKVITGDIRDASNIFGASSFHVITTRRSQGMRFCARWMIFCVRAQDFLCREADFIWYTGRSGWRRS